MRFNAAGTALAVLTFQCFTNERLTREKLFENKHEKNYSILAGLVADDGFGTVQIRSVESRQW